MQAPQRPSRIRKEALFTAVVGSLLDDGIAVRFRAGGRSMAPTVRDGEYLIVAPLGRANVQVGDVVFCDLPRGPVAHRVVAIESAADGSPRFTLCGDAASGCDRPAGAEQLRGKVMSVERGGERVSLAIVGGWIGRLAVLTALRLRRTMLAARAHRPAAPFLPVRAPR